MDGKRLIQLVLLGGRDFEQYAILLGTRFHRAVFCYLRRKQMFVAAGTRPVYETLVKANVPFPRQTAYFVSGVEFVSRSQVTEMIDRPSSLSPDESLMSLPELLSRGTGARAPALSFFEI